MKKFVALAVCVVTLAAVGCGGTSSTPAKPAGSGSGATSSSK